MTILWKKQLAAMAATVATAACLCGQTTNPAAPPGLNFTAKPEAGGLRFTPQPPPLAPPVAGAPASFYTYYWEFGDGDFSFEASPVHVYGKPGSYDVMLYATAHYDDNQKPPDGYTRAEYADAAGPGAPPADVLANAQAGIGLKAQRQPRAGEELACIISYRNTAKLNTEGRLHLFYNEKKFKQRHFDFEGARAHFGETAEAVGQAGDDPPPADWTAATVPGTAGAVAGLFALAAPPPTADELLTAARREFRNEQTWRFGWLEPGEKHNLFVTLRGTADMLRDTSAFIHLRGVFEPFDPAVPAEEFTLEIEIVSSHDPNLIAVSDNRVDYRRLGREELAYKVRFQNNGEGPARRIQLTVQIPEGLNAAKMHPLNWYPACPICPDPNAPISCLDTATTANALIFTFHNIYLPGSRQKGVSDYDSTKGFVRYRIEPQHRMPKLAFHSQAQIVFDKNPPIHTNFSKTRFKMGLSPGLKAGYALDPDNADNNYLFLGLSLSPYKSWKVYPQIELLTGLRGQTELPKHETQTSTFKGLPSDVIVGSYLDTVITTVTTGSQGFVSLEVPLLLRKNFTRFFGAGIGVSGRMFFENAQTTTLTDSTVYVYVKTDSDPPLNPPVYILQDKRTLDPGQSSDHSTTTYTRFAVFGDLTFGAVRAGLNLGVRGGLVLQKRPRPFVQISLEMKL